ncbi:GAF domain-containing protein [Myxococcaceae bacterium GXIMD 01537]
MVEAFAKISEASKLLVDKGFTSAAVSEALGMVGASMEVGRVLVFENRTFGTRGRFLADQRHGWTAPGLTAAPELRGLALRELAANWAESLAAGNVVSCVVREAPPPMRILMEPRQVQSILLCPIAPSKEWWGFVSFEDCRQPRRWLPEEVTLQRALARALGASIRQSQMRSSLDQARMQLREVVKSCSGTSR